VIIRFFRFLLRCCFGIRVEGDLPALRAGRVLVVANHDSMLDGALLGLFLPGVTVAIAGDGLRRPLVRLLMRWVPHVILGPSDPLALKRLIRLVRRGRPVVVFPQGPATATGSLTKIYDAAAVIAAHCDASIVPVRITGTLYSSWSAVGGNFPKRVFPRIRIQVLPARKLPPASQAAGKRRRRQQADALLGIMQHMMFDSQPRLTLFEALVAAAQLHGRRTRILEDTQREHSYGDLIKASLALGRLGGKLAEEGEIVGVMMPNIAATVAALFGLSAMRRIPALLNYTAGPDALRSACIAAGIKTLVTSRRFVEVAKLGSSVAALSTVRIVYLEDLRAKFGLVDKLWLIGWALWRPLSVVRGRDPEETAVVLFTSGSEARPKGVALSHRALLANIAQMGAVIDYGPNDKFLNSLPIYHAYSLTACTLQPLLTGTRMYLYTTPLHYHVIPEIAYTRGCTYVFGTSTFLAHYARQAHPYDFHRTRVVVSGAEKLNPDVASLWLSRFGLRIMEGYGATECAPVLSLNTPLNYRPGTVGRLLPGVEHRLLPVSGIARGGVLHVHGPNVMRGYYLYDRPGELQPPVSEAGAGWYNTGDVVELDEEGFVTIHGRVKRFAKIAGEMISLEVVERIAQHASPGYQHAAAIELVSQGESTVLFTTDPVLDRVLLQKAARELGAQDLAVARRVVRVVALPMLGSGKTDYVKLKSLADPGAPGREQAHN
jgi:acyl-[acyl-carrier-protein]-phospholipid O-acyltransferase/long-chain-fatty-acid--[acyl-carrier-protein] ligase